MFGLVNLLLAASFSHVDSRKYTVSAVERGSGICELPIAVGDCTRQFPRFYYNSATQSCHRFTYSGCGGNANRFVTREHCKQRCEPDWQPQRTKVTAKLSSPSLVEYNNTVCDGCREKNGICLHELCQCRKGYEMVKDQCKDINECLWEKCPVNSLCVNDPGTFHCECAIGFAGSGFNCTKSIEVCGQNFDKRYEEKCDHYRKSSYELRYYYNKEEGLCKQFWYGGCQFQESGNFFRDIQTCESLCNKYQAVETTTRLNRDTTTQMSLPEICLDKFEESRRRPCKTGDWNQRFFYDDKEKRCKMFWWDESCGAKHFSSRNVFILKSTCQRACEGINPDDEDYGNWDPYEYKMVKLETAKYPSAPTAQSLLPQPSEVLQSTYLTKPDQDLLVKKTKTIGVIQAHFSLMTSTDGYQVHGEDKEGDIDGFEDAFGNFHMSDRAKVVFPNPTSLSISTDCLEPFDVNLTRSCSNGHRPWQPKFYYDSESRRCRMYWNDGCMSLAKNNFEDLRSCEWVCHGASLKPEAGHCLDQFDNAYLDNCQSNKFEIRYFFNHQRKECELFYYGGCRAKSRNIFENYRDCEDLCQRPTPISGDVCSHRFEEKYRDSCDRNGSYAQYYYFDQQTESCRMFWYGNCKGRSQNIFSTLETCQWMCEKKKEEKIPAHCVDKFEEKYRKPCNNGVWVQRWYFEHKTGTCKHFWYDGCVGTSQNIFVSEKTCKNLCENPALPTQGSDNAIAEKLTEEKDAQRCMESLELGSCHYKLPAYYYNSVNRRCEPFIYSGCDGNGNRFLTLSQCNKSCSKFQAVNVDKTGCFQTLNAGFGRHNRTCVRKAGFRFYYNSQYQKCGRFWYFGCGGNENRFKSHEKCMDTCGLDETSALKDAVIKSVSACFQPIKEGVCTDASDVFKMERWAYQPDKASCVSFDYSGCNGNDNNFNAESECKIHCTGLKPPKSEQCQFQPDWGPCNMLRQQWYYNLTTGTCSQFLWGGCGGNTNRFETFEACQAVCEIPGGAPPPKKDPCVEKLDRGKWCEAMSNRYYYHQKSRTCKGFHYTGCGKSSNNFVELEECENTCIKRRKTAQPVYVVDNVNSNGTGYSHAKPEEEPDPEQHIILQESVKRYVKTSGEWIDYGHCVGFRYNISGSYTRLNSYLCLMEQGGSCEVQTYMNTDGEEKCYLLRPWIRGSHFYTWFFTVDRKPWKWTPSTRRKQSAHDTIATLIVLPLNDCHSVC